MARSSMLTRCLAALAVLVPLGCAERGRIEAPVEAQPEAQVPGPPTAPEAAGTATAAAPASPPCCPALLAVPVAPSADYPGPTISVQLERQLPSDDGRFSACSYRARVEEAVGALRVCEGSRVLSTQLFTGPIAWEPKGGRLLVHDVAPDDDPHTFVLDVAKGQVEKTPMERMRTRVGDRYDRFDAWQGDWICLVNEVASPPVPAARWVPIPDAPRPGPAPRTVCKR
jgi:hypothetical protein